MDSTIDHYDGDQEQHNLPCSCGVLVFGNLHAFNLFSRKFLFCDFLNRFTHILRMYAERQPPINSPCGGDKGQSPSDSSSL